MSRAIEDLEPDTRAKCVALLQACSNAGFPLLVVATYRSFEEQEALYAKGRSRPGPMVTHARAGDSWHNYRRAFDVCFLLSDGKISWTGPWSDVAEIGRSIGLTWGGDWQAGKQDRPHFEYHPGMSLEEAKAKAYIPK